MQIHYSLLATGGAPGGADRSGIRLRLAGGDLTPLRTTLLPAPVELPCAAEREGRRSATGTGRSPTWSAGSASRPASGRRARPALRRRRRNPGRPSRALRRVTRSATLYGVGGHMHLLGRSIKVELNPGTAGARTLLDVPAFNFDDQAVRPVGERRDGQAGRHVPGDLHARRRPAPAAAGAAQAPTPLRGLGRGHADEMCLAIVIEAPAILTSRRAAHHRAVSAALARLGDDEIGERVAAARVIGTGIGGDVARLDIAGAAVFVKRIPLTDLELGHPLSTANLFDLPPFCQYGSAGSAARASAPGGNSPPTRWRPNWVLTGRSAAFPLLYHWRVLPGAAPPADGARRHRARRRVLGRLARGAASGSRPAPGHGERRAVPGAHRPGPRRVAARASWPPARTRSSRPRAPWWSGACTPTSPS